jgi:hypothetical protein
VVVPRVLAIGEVRVDVIAPAHVTELSLPEETREQVERQRVAPERLRRRFQFAVATHTPLSRSRCAPASSESSFKSTTGAAPFFQWPISLIPLVLD